MSSQDNVNSASNSADVLAGMYADRPAPAQAGIAGCGAAQGNAMKYDTGKTPVFRGLFAYFPHALAAVADISGYGYEKYKAWGGWRRVPDAKRRYSDALGRHILSEQKGEIFDVESEKAHAAHAAWNALAVLELILSEQKEQARVDKSWVDAACAEKVYAAEQERRTVPNCYTYSRNSFGGFTVRYPSGVFHSAVKMEEAAQKMCAELDSKSAAIADAAKKAYASAKNAANKAPPTGYSHYHDGTGWRVVNPSGGLFAFTRKEETAKVICAELNATGRCSVSGL